MDNEDDKTTTRTRVDAADGIQGVFRGLGDLLRIATNIATHVSDIDVASDSLRTIPPKRSGKGLHGVYGVSVRIGARGKPVLSRFGNVRRTARKRVVIDEIREPIADVFDEDDHILVVAELPGVEESNVSWTIEGQALTIRADSTDRQYSKAVELPASVDEQAVVSCYANGVLELKLWKRPR